MAKRTYLELVREVHRECSLSGDPPASVLNQTGIFNDLTRWVREAAYEIEASRGNWNFLWSDDYSVSITQGNAVTVAQADVGEWDKETFFLDAAEDDYIMLEELHYKVWKRHYSLGTQEQDSPSHFIIQPDNSIRLWPEPDDSYTLTADRWVKPTRMVNSTDTSSIPEEFERTIITLAKVKFAEDQGEATLLMNAQAEYQDWITELEAAQLPNQKHRRVGEQEPFAVVPV
jgi:hypothetical protein